MDIDLEELAAIIELLDKTEFTQFRFEKGDLRIAVSRGGAPLDPAAHAAPPVPAVTTAPASAQAPTPVTVRPAPAQATPTASAASFDESRLAADEIVVRAPLLGTFYRSPKPGEPPFVEVGDKVEPDSALCIVEVMKLMNSVTAGVAGEISQVLAADAGLVEFDQPLFVIRRLP
ncbi:acetyl-CoA carboxylase biotin carboxyl carrier protein [Streptosporangium sp. NPDC051022]|uniref:acetyl-CoA carboxylase biotin carboxyl carrier protein n=1 Tax=Streptosporangium sp. NPDC051022 TaxID=3155752 RepID=UPI00342D7E85